MSVDILLAGIDTSAYTTCFLLYHISRSASAQQRLFSAVKHLKRGSVTSADYDGCAYAKAVLKETFRLSPISVGVGRILNKETVLSGYHVPAGVSYLLSVCLSDKRESNFTCEIKQMILYTLHIMV